LLRRLSAVRKKRGRKEVAKKAAHGFRAPLYGYILKYGIEQAITRLKTKDECFMNAASLPPP
jgi:hypothetical protein